MIFSSTNNVKDTEIIYKGEDGINHAPRIYDILPWKSENKELSNFKKV